MNPPHLPGHDDRLESFLGNLLRAGVMLAALVTGAGGILYLLHDGARHAKDRHIFEPVEPWLRTPDTIFRHAVGLDTSRGADRGRALIQLGLLLLIATPVARVAFSALAFLLERDLVYVVVTLIVLAVLLYSFFAGHLV